MIITIQTSSDIKLELSLYYVESKEHMFTIYTGSGTSVAYYFWINALMRSIFRKIIYREARFIFIQL